MSNTPETIAQTDALIANPTDATQETPEQRIARLEIAFAEARQGNLTTPVDIGEDKPVSIDSIFNELKAFNEEMALKKEESRRYWEEEARKSPTAYSTPDGGLEYRSIPRVAEKSLYGEEKDAEALVGRTRWAKFTATQKAQLRSIRPSDLERMDASQYFGKTSDSLKAHQLSQTNFGLYKALKVKAIREGIF